MTIKQVTKRYALDEYIAYLKTFIGRVKFPEVHVHGTWKPTIADYRLKGGAYLVEAMRRTHIQVNGWSDIAQHATIDPDGYIWEGRSLLSAPASATGYNDNDDDRIHPFMFEMIGNFDIGCERLEGKQLETAIGLTRALVDLFGSKIVFHREINHIGKTCPGSSVDKADFLAKVMEAKKKMDEKDANAIINTYLKPAYANAKTADERKEIGRLADELRKASGQNTQNG